MKYKSRRRSRRLGRRTSRSNYRKTRGQRRLRKITLPRGGYRL